MMPGNSLDDDAIVAMIADDVIAIIRKRAFSQKKLIDFEAKWEAAGAPPLACKLARIIAGSVDGYQAGQDDAIDRIPQQMTEAFGLLREVSSVGVPKAAPEPAVVAASAPTTHALIMKGGGIKGLAYVGAIEHLSRQYTFDWYVGTSAGAVAAVLLGAGYNADELGQILRNKNFRDFFDASWWKKWVNLPLYHGMHPANTFIDWLDKLLAEKLRKPSRVRLSDLPHRVTVYASQRDKSSLRFDSRENDAAAAYAVRCSMSIPFVFTPQTDQGLWTFDGGLQHNFPVNDLLTRYPDAPFISLYLGSEVYEPIKQRWVFKDLISIWTESSDATAITEHRARTVIIDPRPIGTLDFDLTDTEKEFLLASGRAAALSHLLNGSEEQQEANRIRDELKSNVVETRRIKRVMQRLRNYLVLVAIYLLTALGVWYFWLHNAGGENAQPNPPRGVPSNDVQSGPTHKEHSGLLRSEEDPLVERIRFASSRLSDPTLGLYRRTKEQLAQNAEIQIFNEYVDKFTRSGRRPYNEPKKADEPVYVQLIEFTNSVRFSEQELEVCRQIPSWIEVAFGINCENANNAIELNSSSNNTVDENEVYNALKRRFFGERFPTAVLAITKRNLADLDAYYRLATSNKEKFAVLSLESLTDDDKGLTRWRVFSMASYCFVRTLGISECNSYVCGMNESANVGILFGAEGPFDFCPNCLGKIWWACSLDPGVHFQRMIDYAERPVDGKGLQMALPFWKRAHEIITRRKKNK